MSNTHFTDGHERQTYDGPDKADLIDEESLLINLAQLLDSKKIEGCSWSEWDQQQRDGISQRLRYLSAKSP